MAIEPAPMAHPDARRKLLLLNFLENAIVTPFTFESIGTEADNRH